MKRITLVFLLIALSVLTQAQTQPYKIASTDSIQIGKTTGLGGTSLYGKVYLKNVGLGSSSDSILTVRNGRIFKVPVSGVTPDTTVYRTVANSRSLAQTQIALDLKAPLASPTFTGTVTAPIFSGSLTGNASTATLSSTISTTSFSGAGTFNLAMMNGTTVYQTGTISATPSTGAINATTFIGALTGNASTVTTNANLTGEVTSVGNAATLTNSAVIGKVLTGYTSGAGTVDTTDNILQAIQKLNGNDALKANLASPTFTGTVTAPTAAFTDLSVSNNIVGNITGNSATATNLAATRTIWGQNFNGSANVTGALSGATTGDFSSTLTSGGTLNTNAEFAISATNAGTGRRFANWANTSGSILWGIENSTGGSLYTGAPAWSAAIGSNSGGGPLVLGTNGIARYTIDASGNNTWTGSGTFTGTVTIPTPFTLGAVSVTPTGTELNYVDGVTSAIQTQLDGKAPLASPALTGTPTAPTASAGTNNTQIATTAYVDRLGGGTITSGTYTPTLTNSINVSSSSANPFTYMRIGNIVSVWGSVSVTPTSNATLTELGITLPVASNLTTSTDLSGNGTVNGASTAEATTGPTLQSDATNDRAKLTVTPPLTSTLLLFITFSYTVL